MIDAPDPAAELAGAVLAARRRSRSWSSTASRSGELLGLEVARVNVDDEGGTRIEVGVGRFDREMFAMMHRRSRRRRSPRTGDQHRRPVPATRRPAASAQPARAANGGCARPLLGQPDLVGAVELRPVQSAVPPAEPARGPLPATAVGTGPDGEPVVVVVLDGHRPRARADGGRRPALHADRPDARLVLVVPERDVPSPSPGALAAGRCWLAGRDRRRGVGDWRRPDAVARSSARSAGLHLEHEFADVEARLADPDVLADQARYGELARRHKELEPIVSRCPRATAAHRRPGHRQGDAGRLVAVTTGR